MRHIPCSIVPRDIYRLIYDCAKIKQLCPHTHTHTNSCIIIYYNSRSIIISSFDFSAPPKIRARPTRAGKLACVRPVATSRGLARKNRPWPAVITRILLLLLSCAYYSGTPGTDDVRRRRRRLVPVDESSGRKYGVRERKREK